MENEIPAHFDAEVVAQLGDIAKYVNAHQAYLDDDELLLSVWCDAEADILASVGDQLRNCPINATVRLRPRPSSFLT